MNTKTFLAGALALYALLLLLSSFNIGILIFIPITVSGIPVGKLATAAILAFVAYYFRKG